MTPRVTVVMPVFNGERFIGEAVASVLASTFADFELLVLDDGSSDASIGEAERAAAGDPRLSIVRLAHGGVAAARNTALEMARGELIANLDADDLMFRDRLRRQVAHFEVHPECVAVGTRALIIDAEGRPTGIGVSHFTHEEIDRANLHSSGAAMWNPTVTFRRQAAIDVGGYTPHLTRTGEDHDLWLRLAERGRMANLPLVLTRYRVHGANVSLDDSDRDRRRQVRQATLARAFERRGITEGQLPPMRSPAKSMSARWRDRALLEYFRGNRNGAIAFALAAGVLSPTASATRSAFWTVVSDSSRV